MKSSVKTPLDFVIDKLTNSIENSITGEVFDTEVVQLTEKILKQIKKTDWQFDWSKEIKDKTKEVYKLTTEKQLDNYSGAFKHRGQEGPHFYAPY